MNTVTFAPKLTFLIYVRFILGSTEDGVNGFTVTLTVVVFPSYVSSPEYVTVAVYTPGIKLLIFTFAVVPFTLL